MRLLFLFFPFLLSCVQNNANKQTGSLQQKDNTPVEYSTESSCDNTEGKALDSLSNVLDAFELDESIKAPERAAMQAIYKRRMESIQQNQAWQRALGLPESVRILEMISIKGFSNRAIMLYMNRPRVAGSPGAYWCGSSLIGDAYITGDAFFSLVDIANKKIINTQAYRRETRRASQEEQDCLYVPLFYLNIENDQVIEMGVKHPDGRPATVLILSDLNGDGVAGDFLLPQYISCGNEEDMMMGYYAEKDSLIFYDFDLRVTDKNTTSGKDSSYQQTVIMLPNLARHKPNEKGEIVFAHDYAHGSESGYLFNLHFNQALRKFEGTMTCVPVESLYEK